MEQKYNGWSNYATWRINLECIDSVQFVREDITSSEEELTVADVAQFLHNAVEEQVGEYGELDSGLAYDYAMAFLNEVDWYEIARHFIEANPDIVTAS